LAYINPEFANGLAAALRVNTYHTSTRATALSQSALGVRLFKDVAISYDSAVWQLWGTSVDAVTLSLGHTYSTFTRYSTHEQQLAATEQAVRLQEVAEHQPVLTSAEVFFGAHWARVLLSFWGGSGACLLRLMIHHTLALHTLSLFHLPLCDHS
jgi:hypothetical protein